MADIQQCITVGCITDLVGNNLSGLEHLGEAVVRESKEGGGWRMSWRSGSINHENGVSGYGNNRPDMIADLRECLADNGLVLVAREVHQRK